MSAPTNSYTVLTITAPGESLQLQTRGLSRRLPPTGVLVKVRAAGVCHTDLHLWQGFFALGKGQKISFADRPGFGYPRVPGHEIAGVVAALGSQAENDSELKLGDRVAVYPWIGCEECGICKAGDSHLCAGLTKQLGFNVDGGYSEYVTLPHHKFVIKVPAEVTDEVAAMVPCSVLTAYSAIERCAPTIERVGRWGMELVVVVIGLGGLGQWALKLLRNRVPLARIVGIDISSQKLEFIEKEGLVDSAFLFDSSKPTTELVADYLSKFDQQKPHVVLDFVDCTETFNFGRSLLYKGGCMVLIGLLGGAGEIPLPPVVLNVHTIAGIHVGSLSQLQGLMELVKEHSIKPPPISTYSLKEGGQALEDLRDGRILGRAVLKME